MSGRMTKSPAKVMQKLLIDLGLASSKESGGDYPCYYSNQPDKPDKCFTVYNTDGQVQGRVIGGEALEVHGIQIRLRDIDVETGDNKLNLVATTLAEDVLNTLVDISSSRFKVYAITQPSNIMYIGFDAPNTRRSIWTLNLLMTVTQVN